ncbi:MAG: LPXTG cell wall anchor domain-containing protein [Eubacteriaceae bacterium]|uniref:LPXTG cell wall anchor domain-containing protein n=1 Tax=Candidatus Pseudoramibacter fermentans TaxID=2594427 RepID=A0A6L5GV01_9FIRM|nr:LPXTG cell wall anchor domain-containing protein [Candidatus Pseudoramibacter fermentans]RRF92743.1 MAG: LPXTG cell wall anchor domain-containing protein [Eubacteriaceae bacterium]
MPTQPSGPKNTQTTGTGTKTGDPTNAALPAVAGGIALAGLIILARRKQHNK